ncbi:hypothetical protein [Flavobacterium sp. NRK1]|uniref:hypothetical protein n=1 Tax=Flavobacterium sp. NRK1 TaxID=2954929 RepID=UPI002091FE7E|nr:hypothetical protein [Flavobacterium sp. NRK1]MCO6147558.1 hypothetical protein [Flavobacterium sp. NRK1]
MRKFAVTLLILFLTQAMFAQAVYTLKTEVLIFSFETNSGKILSLSKDVNDKYLIYRFGTRARVEFEYPDKSRDSWKNFKYSYYFRGGGKANDGMDLNYLAFENKGYKYIIYDTYSAMTGKTDTGLRIINLKTSEVSTITAKSKKGSLINFRNSRFIKIDQQLYD